MAETSAEMSIQIQEGWWIWVLTYIITVGGIFVWARWDRGRGMRQYEAWRKAGGTGHWPTLPNLKPPPPPPPPPRRP